MANEFVARNGVIALSNSTITGSLIVTAGITGSLSGSVVGNLTGTASWATSALSSITASYVLQAVSSSFATLAQTANTASYVVTAQTASYFSGTVISASYASTASSADNFTVRGTLTAQTIVAQTITASTEWVTGSSRFGNLVTDTHQFTGSLIVSGSVLYVSSSGQVGINKINVTPSIDLDVNGAIRAGGQISAAQMKTNYLIPNTTNLNFTSGSAITTIAATMFTGSGNWVYQAAQSATDLGYKIAINSAGTSGLFYVSGAMAITAGGVVLVGTTATTAATKFLVSDTTNGNAGTFLGANGDTAVALGNVTGNTGSISTGNTASSAARNLVINPLTSGQGGNVGIGQSNPQYRLDVTGSTRITLALSVGTITPSATVGRIDASNDVVAFSTSDINFKTNIYPISGALDKITQIGGYEFDWIPNQEYHGFKGHDVGVIAQEIEKVLPEVVTTRDNGYKGVKYEKIVPLLIQAIKEQQKQIEDLQRQINYLVENK
jgi:hypothetical protein